MRIHKLMTGWIIHWIFMIILLQIQHIGMMCLTADMDYIKTKLLLFLLLVISLSIEAQNTFEKR